MSLFGLQRGQPQTESLNLPDASAHDIVIATGPGLENGLDVTDILVSNNSAGAVPVTISRYDGTATTAYPVWTSKSVPANDSILLSFPFRLLRGWSVRATGTTALTVHVSYMQTAN